MNNKLTPENFSTENFKKFLNDFSLEKDAENLEEFQDNAEFKTQVAHELGQTFISMFTIAEILEIDLEESIQKAFSDLSDACGGESCDEDCDDDCDEDCDDDCTNSSCSAQ